MRFKVAHKLAAVVLIPALVALGLSAFTLSRIDAQQQAERRLGNLNDRRAQLQ